MSDFSTETNSGNEDYFKELKEAINESAFHTDERHVALYFPEEADEYSEDWQIVFDPDNQPSLKSVHHLVPLSERESTLAELSAHHKSIEVLGETYDVKPYSIGHKTLLASERDYYAQEIAPQIYTRENFKSMLAAEQDDDPVTHRQKLEMIDRFSDQEFTEFVKPYIEQNIEAECAIVTPEQAKIEFERYLLSTNKQEMELRQEKAQEKFQEVAVKLKFG